MCCGQCIKRSKHKPLSKVQLRLTLDDKAKAPTTLGKEDNSHPLDMDSKVAILSLVENLARIVGNGKREELLQTETAEFVRLEWRFHQQFRLV